MNATKGLVSLAVALAGVLSGFAEAVDISGKDPSDWPRSGDIAITSGTITVTDDEVDIVAGWDTVAMQPSATLQINNTSKPLVFKAKIGGNCWFRADDSCGLTLAGDNSGHWGNQRFKFVDSNIIVAHEYGLGKKDNLLPCEFTYTVGKSTGNLTFHDPAWDEPGFTGKKAFTNHCHIIFKLSGTAAYPDDGKFLAIGSSAADEYFVQDANLLFDYTAKQTSFRYNYEQISGQFGPSFQTTGYTFTRQSKDYAGELRFSGETKINGAYVENTTQFGNWVNYHRNTHFGHSGGTHIIYARDQGNDFLEADDVFDDFVAGCDPVGYQPIAMDQSVYKNSMNLQGHSVRFKNFQNYYSAVPTEKSSGYYYLTSAVPTTVTLYRATKTGEDTEKPTPTELRGAVSLVVDNGITNRISTRVSKTEGTLTVKSGSALVYQWNGGWAGSDVTVEAGATIDAQSAKSFATATAALVLEDGARFVMHAGIPVKFTSVTAGGTTLDVGDYTRARLRDEFGLGDAFVGDDDAVLFVADEIGEFKGWPDAPGATVDIPKNFTVTVAETDLENVAKAAKIRMDEGAKLVFSSLTGAVRLNANVLGYGTIRFVDCADVEIAGDNSGLSSSASVYIENSKVRVLKGSGLGSAWSGRATLAFGTDATRRVYFGAADTADTVTNLAPIRLDYVSTGTKCYLGEGVAGKKLVLAGDVKIAKVGTYVLQFFGEVEFLSDIDGLAWSSTRAIKFNGGIENNVGAHVTFGEGVDISVSGDTSANTYALYHNGASHPNGVNTPLFTYKCANRQERIGTLHFNVPDVEIASPNVFGTAETTECTLYYFGDVGLYLNTLRLSGNDASFASFASQYAAAHAPAAHYADVESPVPAYLVYAKAAEAAGIVRAYPNKPPFVLHVPFEGKDYWLNISRAPVASPVALAAGEGRLSGE